MPNLLGKEKSPYLIQHQDNPVNWMPWGDAAFQKARKENKPIFLSVGYSTCHWCHVMAHESFENASVADFLNEHFVPIKVDREERPDIDHLYMMFVQVTTGHGGWPMNVWLTPDLKPFFGGTYYPPIDTHGRPGFLTLLQQIQASWAERRVDIELFGAQIIEDLKKVSAGKDESKLNLDHDAIAKAYREFLQRFDSESGGFGGAPKFPRPVAQNFLFRVFGNKHLDETQRRHAYDMASYTLKKMAFGGLHDHLAGGFHRYSVDKYWNVPHFEKMLYDQALLLQNYLDAYQLSEEPFYGEIAEDIINYVFKNLTAPEGYFYSAEDADSIDANGKHREGAYYVFEEEEIKAQLTPEEFEVFSLFYCIEGRGNVSSENETTSELYHKNILLQANNEEQFLTKFPKFKQDSFRLLMASAKAKILAYRELRARPHLDDKLVTAWNSLMIAGLARAATLFQKEDWLQAAEKAFKFIQENLLAKNGKLLRSYRNGASEIEAFADDYSTFIAAAIELYQATFNTDYLMVAEKFQNQQNDLFWDNDATGYFMTQAKDHSVLVRMKPDYDGAEPSANSLSALNLIKLGRYFNNSVFVSKAELVLKLYSFRFNRMGEAMPQMLVALDEFLTVPQYGVLTGTAKVEDFLKEIRRYYSPARQWIRIEKEEQKEFWVKKFAYMKDMNPEETKLYLCDSFRCQKPIDDPKGIKNSII
jgi:hypothetical protein